MNIRTILAFSFVLQAGHCIHGQDMTVKRIELQDDNVLLFYELKDTTQRRVYTVNLYSSRDNFISPLQNVRGDVGLEVVPGGDRKIIMNAREEFGATFEGKVAFELRAKVYIPFVRMDKLNNSYKRGKPYEIRWSGGRPQNVLNFDLFKGENKITSFSNIANAGKYNMVIPTDTKPGKNYRFRISDSKNKDEIVNTGSFTVSRKVPLLVKVVPVVLIGGGLYFALKPAPECEGCLTDFPAAPKN
jgi:hypothetical protein